MVAYVAGTCHIGGKCCGDLSDFHLFDLGTGLHGLHGHTDPKRALNNMIVASFKEDETMFMR